MKFDMHCHTKTGSIDSKVSIETYIEILKNKGFSGMLVTDHDSYKGYRKWERDGGKKKVGDFVVLRGVEYDTKDAGHFLVILPEGIELEVLQIRGMDLDSLISLVHANGGILGPAHPFGTKSSSAMYFKRILRNMKIFKSFDFIEGFNSCERSLSNNKAMLLATRYGKPCIAGSDSHQENVVGMAFTEFEDEIHDNNQLIEAIKNGRIKEFGGETRPYTKRTKHKEAIYGVIGFKMYNRGLGTIFAPYRKYKLKQEKYY